MKVGSWSQSAAFPGSKIHYTTAACYGGFMSVQANWAAYHILGYVGDY